MLAFDVAWEAVDVGPKHHTLYGPSPGTTTEERAQLVAKAMEELEAEGLADAGYLDPDLLDTLSLIARAGSEFFCWFNPDGVEQHAAVAASNGQDAVIAVTDGAAVAFTPIRPTALAESLTAALPYAEPASDHAINVPKEVFEAEHKAGAPTSTIMGGRRGANNDAVAARTLLTILQRPRTGNGKLYAAERDRLGKRYRSESWVDYVDTPEGRTLLVIKSGSDGRPWILALPGTEHHMIDQLNRLMSD